MTDRRIARSHVLTRSSSSVRLLAIAALVVLLSLGLANSTSTQGSSQTPAQPDAQPETPRFRAETNFVRVDVYATLNGAPVRDLRADDFEVFEDGVPQKIETFEHVDVRAPRLRNEGREPQSVAEGRAMAEDPRARVFVIFLDIYHTDRASSRVVRQPLIDFLNRVIGPDDLVGVMTPEMSARELSLGRRTDTTEGVLSRYWWGRRDDLAGDRDAEERMYEACFPEQGAPRECAGITGKRMQSSDTYKGVAEEMIDRRREKRALDALEDLVTYLHGVRDERKAVLVVSDGWRLFRSNPNLARIGVCDSPPGVTTIGVGPEGKLTTDLRRDQGYQSRTACDRDRQTLAGLDNWLTFSDLLNRANRANVSFYPIDARGLPASDTPIERREFMTVSGREDRARLQHRVGTLQTLAEETDGLAVVSSNDIERGMRRIVDDLTSYYLLGYYSPNDKLDGKFRAIKVRVKRPGIDVRARRGYAAPTQEELERGRQTLAAAAASAPPTAIQSALASLASVRRDARLHSRVSWASPPPHVWVTAELDTTAARTSEWASGGTADVLLVAERDGETVGSARTQIAPGSRVVSVDVPTGPLQPGTYTVRLRLAPAGGGSPLVDSVSFTVSEEEASLGSPRLFRRGPTAAGAEVLAANPSFRRTEHLRVDVPAMMTVDGVEAELLDRTGKPIQVPVKSATRVEDGITWVSAEIALAPLAPGDYIVRTSVTHDNRRQEILTAFRVVP